MACRLRNWKTPPFRAWPDRLARITGAFAIAWWDDQGALRLAQ